MPFLSQDELFLPRRDLAGNPTEDNFFHTLPLPDGGQRTVEGFMGDDHWQGHFMYQLGWNTRGIGIELGSFKGLSTIYLAMGMRDSPWQEGSLMAVDWFKDGYLGVTNMLQTFKDNLTAFGVEKYVTPYQGSCEEKGITPTVEAEWCFFDASHYRKEMHVNMEIYGSMVKPGGLYLIHDTHMEEVLLFIEEVKQQQAITPVITDRPDFQVWRNPL